MAVANPYLQEDWNVWKKKMEENRRRKWRERVFRWAKMEVNVEKEDEEEYEEDEYTDSEEEDLREEVENEAGGEGEEEEEGEVKREAQVDEERRGEVKEAKDTEEEGGNEGERKVEEEEVEIEEERVVTEEEEEMEEGNEEKEEMVNEEEEKKGDVKEAQDTEEEEEEGGNEGERKVEVEEVDIEEERVMTGEEEMEEGNEEMEEEEMVNGEEEEGDVKEAQDTEEEEEEGGNEEERKVEDEEVDIEGERVVTGAEEVEGGNEEKEEEETVNWEEEEEEEEVMKGAEKLEEGEIMEQNEGEMEVKETEEVDKEEGIGAGRQARESKEVDDEEDGGVKEGEKVEEEDDWENEERQQENTGPYAQFSEHINGRQLENECVQQHQESAAEEEAATEEEDNFSDSIEFNDEDSDWMGSEDKSYTSERIEDEERTDERHCKEPKELGDPGEKSRRNEKSVLGAVMSEKLMDEFWTTNEEEFQKYLQEEEKDSTDHEEAEHSTSEDMACDDEDVVKIYCKDDYSTDIFRTLTEFRDSSLLTDLNLSTEGGMDIRVHSPVLAAVSSLIWESMSRSNTENNRDTERKGNDNDSIGINRWSVSLGPEVDHVGLEAIVEFAYSGLISCLNKGTMEQIKVAAQTLGATRVLDLCTEEESTTTGGKKKEERVSAAEQMTISLQSIKQLWMDRVGCDVVLDAVGKSLQAHRVILAASSDYFRGMFTLGMRESHQPRVTLPFLLVSELEVLISSSYSGGLPLSWGSVFEITSTARQLQYQPALSLCLNFLQEEINPNSCLDVASFAKAYEMAHLLEVADDFVLRQFQKVACTSKFKDLPARQLFKYLKSHSLCVPSELVVFKAVVAWIQAKPKIRLKLAKELMKTIHFPLMTFKEFKEVQSLDMWSHHSLVELYEAVFEDFCSNKTDPQSHCRIYLPKESLVLIGGDQISEDLGTRRISRDLWFGNSLRNHTGIKKAMEWRRLGEMPEPARYSHEVAVLRGQLYVFGGKKYYGSSDTLNSVYRYDPLQNSWETLAEMQQNRCSFSVVVLDGKIYAIGGHCDPEYIDSVERYCPTANSWSFTWPLDLPLSGHVAKVLQGQIFISGGLNCDYTCLASMFLYHPETGSTYLANMTKPRALHCMDTLGDRLYVAGGITTDRDTTVVDQLACEVYSPEADSWSAFTSLTVPHVGAGSAVLEGKFYVLGGYSQEDYSDITMVHRYDPTTQRWENMGKMPGPNNDIRACLLCLPSHFRL